MYRKNCKFSVRDLLKLNGINYFIYKIIYFEYEIYTIIYHIFKTILCVHTKYMKKYVF